MYAGFPADVPHLPVWINVRSFLPLWISGYPGKKIDYSKYRVLLVEDNELNREIAIELLSLIGIQVEEAENGARAVEIFKASPEQYFDLIFMDIQMPVMNGYEATRQIRSMSRQDAKDIWIVAMMAPLFCQG